MLSVSYSSVREFPVILHSVLLIQKLFLNLSIVLFIMCCLQCVCIMSLMSFFMFITVLVVSMIVLLNCSLFLVLHIWVGIAMVKVNIIFLVLDGSDNADVVNMCCNDVYYFLVTSLYF